VRKERVVTVVAAAAAEEVWAYPLRGRAVRKGGSIRNKIKITPKLVRMRP